MYANVNVLMCVYQEETFLPYALQACLPFVKSICIVEGAYKETIALGSPPRSTDKTISIARRFAELYPEKVQLIHANERSDKDQRNVGLEAIRKRDPNGWLLIIDGDELYSPITFKMIAALTKKMDNSKSNVAYFHSLTFVNDFHHYCDQEFPRLFRITKDCQYVNDNFMQYGEEFSWQPPEVIKSPHISFFHYSFCKGADRFQLKKRWWETRFKQPFNYSWRIDEGVISDSQHQIKPFTSPHPDVMKGHPLNG